MCVILKKKGERFNNLSPFIFYTNYNIKLLEVFFIYNFVPVVEFVMSMLSKQVSRCSFQ